MNERLSALAAGRAPGLISMSQQIGDALGVAILVPLANSRTHSLLHVGGYHVAAASTPTQHEARSATATPAVN